MKVSVLMTIDLQDPVVPNASRPSLHVVQAVSPENVGAAERWSKWQLRNVATSRKDATRARIAFIAIFALLGAWLVRLLLVS
jgi:hypothetical protein